MLLKKQGRLADINELINEFSAAAALLSTTKIPTNGELK